MKIYHATSGTLLENSTQSQVLWNNYSSYSTILFPNAIALEVFSLQIQTKLQKLFKEVTEFKKLSSKLSFCYWILAAEKCLKLFLLLKYIPLKFGLHDNKNQRKSNFAPLGVITPSMFIILKRNSWSKNVHLWKKIILFQLLWQNWILTTVVANFVFLKIGSFKDFLNVLEKN